MSESASAAKIAAHPDLCLDAKLILAKQTLPSPHDPTVLPSVDQTRAALERALVEYRSSRVRDGVGLGILTANRWLISGAIGAATLVMPPVGIVAQLTTAGTAFMLDQLLEGTVDLFAEHTAARSRQQLAAHLHALREQQNLDLDGLSAMDPAQARERVFGDRAGFLARLEQMELREDEKQIVEAHLQASFEDAVARQLALGQLADEARDTRLDQLQASVSDVLATQRSLLDFHEAANQRFTRMQDTLAAVSTGLTELQRDVDELRGDVVAQGRSVAFLESYVFARMPPAEQRSALERGMFSDMPAAERQRRLQQLELLEGRQNLIDATKSALHGAQILTTLAGELGVDPELVHKAQQLVSVGNTALEVSAALASGQWLTAVGSLTKLLGGTDIASSRHNQIMGALAALQRGQLQILQNQSVILDRQRMILENQQRLFEALGKISEQIRESHEQIMDELHRQRAEIRVNRSIMIGLLRKRLETGERFLELRTRSRSFEFWDGRFHSYAGLVLHYQSYPHLFQPAAEDVDSLVKPGSLSPIFHLVSYPDALGDTPVADVQRAHQLLLAAFERAARRAGIQSEELCASLLLPSRTLSHARKKLRARATIGDRQRARLGHISSVLREPIATETIHLVARWILETHFYYQLFERPFGDMCTPEEIVARRSLSPHGRILLEDIHLLVEGAIAQVALQSGDVIIADLVETLRGLHDDGRTDALEEDALELLSRNNLLQRNVLRDLVQQLLGESDVFVLDVARRGPELGWLQRLIPKPWVLERDGDDWLLVFASSRRGEYRFALPSTAELIQRDITHSTDLLPLLDLRERLAAAMLAHDPHRTRDSASLILAAASRKG